MERETAEVIDPREDRTSAIRTRLNNILSSRLTGLSATPSSSKVNDPTSQTPLASTNELPKGTPTGALSLPHLPPLGFDSSDPEMMRRALTPIVEASPAVRNPALPVDPGAHPAKPVQQSDEPAPPSDEIRSEDQVPSSTTPAPVSPPSAYTPTDPPSTPISLTHVLSEELAKNASVPKPNPETVISVDVGVSGEHPSNDDGQAHDGPAASTPSLQSSAASPPSLSPANSSNPPTSASPGLAPPRTPSPKFSVLTSPHSMLDSPTRAMGQTIMESGSSTERLSRQSLTPPTPLRAATVVASSKLPESIQESTPPSRDGTLDIYDQAGAMFYLHNLHQGSLEVDSRPLPDPNGKDVSSESEGVDGQFVHQPTVAPLRTKGSTSPPPQQPTGPKPLSVDTVQHRKPPNQQLPRTPTLEYGPERRPFGARAAPVSHRQDTLTSSTHSPRNLSMRSSKGDTNVQPGITSQLEDQDADALAALSYLDLERHDDVTPAAPVPSSPTIRPEVVTSPAEPQRPPTIIEPDVRSPSPDSESASVYKSSFAPSKNAMQRKKKSEAQQAAHEAATHRPGRGAGKTKSKSKGAGGWEDSSEEEEEEDEEEEDVDSDGQPAAPRDDRSVSNYTASANNHRSQYSSPRGPSPLASGDAPSYQPQPQPHARPPRHLPPVPPSRSQGLSLPS